MFGWGLYFADRKEVADYYRDTLSRSTPDARGGTYEVTLPDDNYLLWEEPLSRQTKAVIAVVKEKIIPGITLHEVEEPDANGVRGFLAIAPGGLGNAFTVWGETTKAAFKCLVRSELLNGAYIYNTLSMMLRSPKEASLYLASHGVPGTKYLDQRSRAGQSATYNYVIYDDRHVTVKAVHEDAFHGTPHQFDKFSTDKIGTGEGNQVFGWGLYFTDLEDIAHHYRRALTEPEDEDGQPSVSCWLDKKHFIDGRKPMNTMTPLEIACIVLWGERMNVSGAIEWLDWDIENFAERERRTSVSLTVDNGSPFSPQERQERREYRAKLIAAKEIVETENFYGRLTPARGLIYHVELPDTDDWLLWHSDADHQPQVVRDAMAAEGISKEVTPQWRYSGMTRRYGYPTGTGQDDFAVVGSYRMAHPAHPEDGFDVVVHTKPGGSGNHARVKTEEEAMRMIEANARKQTFLRTGGQLYLDLADELESAKAASLTLKRHGVPGVKYRNGEGSGFNYVVFDEGHVKIKAAQRH